MKTPKLSPKLLTPELSYSITKSLPFQRKRHYQYYLVCSKPSRQLDVQI